MALSQPSDMIARYDARTLGDLCSDDGSRVSKPDLATNAIMRVALDDATSMILAHLLKAERYTQEELAQVSAEGQPYLVYLNCLVAWANLWRRRDMTKANESKYKLAIDEAAEKLDELRTGKTVLDLAPQKAAGRADTTPPAVSAIKTQWNLLRDRIGYFPRRRGIR